MGLQVGLKCLLCTFQKIIQKKKQEIEPFLELRIMGKKNSIVWNSKFIIGALRSNRILGSEGGTFNLKFTWCNQLVVMLQMYFKEGVFDFFTVKIRKLEQDEVVLDNRRWNIDKVHKIMAGQLGRDVLG
jgi:hypothetical protein